MRKKPSEFIDSAFVNCFRVWDGEKMLHQVGFSYGNGYSLAQVLLDEDMVPMQKISYEKNIWEGDLVKVKNDEALYCIQRIGFNFFLVDVKSTNIKKDKKEIPINFKNITVVGNIFETFNLIKQQ